MGISQLLLQLRQRCLPYYSYSKSDQKHHHHHFALGGGLLLLLLLAIGTFESPVPLVAVPSATTLIIGTMVTLFLASQADFIYRSWLTLERDLTGLFLLIKIRLDMRRRMRENKGIQQIFVDVVNANPNGICAIDMTSNKQYTFREFNALANRFANTFLQNGYRSGDVVALFMENSAEFVAAWIGLAKIGVVTAWINSNLRMDSLVHCLRVSECKAVLCSDILKPTLEAAAKQNDATFMDALCVYGLSKRSPKCNMKRCPTFVQFYASSSQVAPRGCQSRLASNTFAIIRWQLALPNHLTSVPMTAYTSQCRCTTLLPASLALGKCCCAGAAV